MRSINKLLTSWKKVGLNIVPVNIIIVFFLQKRKEGTLYMRIDYRAFKANTIIDTYPVPCIDDILNHLGG